MPLRPVPNKNENAREWMRSVHEALQAGLPARGIGVPTFDAPVGSIYINTRGGVGTTLYVKEEPGPGGWRAK